MWLMGFSAQVIADLQKLWFRLDPANKLKVCKRGFWAYSRHPNYFGEMAMWWGIFISSAVLWRDHHPDGYASIVSPLFTMLIILFLSGMPTAERDGLKRYYTSGDELRNSYVAYRARIAPIVPCSPPLYSALPIPMKQACCCEFPCYEFNSEQQPLTAAVVT